MMKRDKKVKWNRIHAFRSTTEALPVTLRRLWVVHLLNPGSDSIQSGCAIDMVDEEATISGGAQITTPD